MMIVRSGTGDEYCGDDGDGGGGGGGGKVKGDTKKRWSS